VRLRTGDLLRIEARADVDGFATVLIFGSGGSLEVLLPNEVAREHALRAGQGRCVTGKLTPPAGTERVAVIWTRQRVARSAAEWRDWISRDVRGVAFVEQHVRGWTAVVVSVEHHESAG
jgi:hypothetical protein